MKKKDFAYTVPAPPHLSIEGEVYEPVFVVAIGNRGKIVTGELFIICNYSALRCFLETRFF